MPLIIIDVNNVSHVSVLVIIDELRVFSICFKLFYIKFKKNRFFFLNYQFCSLHCFSFLYICISDNSIHLLVNMHQLPLSMCNMTSTFILSQLNTSPIRSTITDKSVEDKTHQQKIFSLSI